MIATPFNDQRLIMMIAVTLPHLQISSIVKSHHNDDSVGLCGIFVKTLYIQGIIPNRTFFTRVTKKA